MELVLSEKELKEAITKYVDEKFGDHYAHKVNGIYGITITVELKPNAGSAPDKDWTGPGSR